MRGNKCILKCFLNILNKCNNVTFTQKLVLNNCGSIININRKNISNYNKNSSDNMKRTNLSLIKLQKENFSDKNKTSSNQESKKQESLNSNNIEKNFLKLDYYTILNIKPNFSESELRRNYVNLAKHFHPDRFKGSPEIFKKLSEAYQTLKDTNKRDEYNKKLKIKIHKSYKKHREDSAEHSTESEELRNSSKFESDFKKLNIDKLFHDFSSKKIRTSHEKIKTYKSNIEKKMTSREYKIHELLIEYKQNQMLSKDVKHQFYKEFGIIKDDELKKNYSELVKDEIERIKKKKKIYEQIKEEEKKELDQEAEYSNKLQVFFKRLIIFYILSIFVVLYYKQRNTKIAEEYKKKEIEQAERKRFSNYVYIGNSKI